MILGIPETYDYGLAASMLGYDFDACAAVLALGCTDSNYFLAQYDALERGWAKGLQNLDAIRKVAL
jgi:hypothetical protein